MIQSHSFHAHAVDEIGMPNLAYELFYQQGMSCYRWGLPRPYVLQALRAVCERYSQRFGSVAFWQLRAFAYGLRGLDDSGHRQRACPAKYRWPLPPDAAWQTVVCLYPDGQCDLDFVHPVSRRFWSEDNGFLELPSYDPLQLGGWWFEEMGFEVMRMQPAMSVRVAEAPNPHLKPVR
ncbi:hypothetical protein FCG41_17955 [Azotobacter chroococcum]|nr:hypothetical protein FCG41_17955 [Azotobacter chroococcum]